MADISIDPLAALVSGVLAWSERNVPRSKAEREKRTAAIQTVLDAAIETKSYLYERDVLGKISRQEERNLSSFWRKASTAIQVYDKELFHISQVKALGWSDPREWRKKMATVSTVNVDTIIEQCNFLLAE